MNDPLKVANDPLKVAKDKHETQLPEVIIDWDQAEGHFADVLLEAKALKVKIAEYMKRPPQLQKIDEYSRLYSFSC